MPFSHDIAGGQGNLIATSIQSPNYDEAAGTGWQISKDGTATFYAIDLPGYQSGTLVTFSAAEPSDPVDGQIWYNISEGLAASVYGPGGWTPYYIGGDAIASETITGGNIASATIEPGNIASLTASLIGNLGVLNPNPYFTGGDDTGWSATNGTITVTGTPPSGAPYKYALEYVNNGSANGYAEEVTGKFPVTPGQQYMATAWLYNTGTGATGAIRLSIDWYDGSTYVSTSTGNVTVTTGTWTQATEVFTAPSSGIDAGVVKFGTQTGDGSTVYGQAIIVMPQVPGALIEAGTVTANQIESGTITAGLLESGIVVSGIVDGTLIEASQFVVDETGSGTGLFVYDATPASGTPPIVSATSSDVDPYGNSVRPGDAQTGVPEIIVTGATPSVSGATPTYIQLAPGSTADATFQAAALNIGAGYPGEGFPGKVTSGISGSSPASLITAITAPETTSGGTSTSGQSYLELFTSTNAAPGFGLTGASDYGSYELGMQTASGTSGTYSQFSVTTDAGDVMILLPDLVLMTCQLVAQEPGSPGTSEAWHEAKLASGWENNGGAYAPMRYRLLPDGNLQIDGLVKSTSASATTIFTLPTGYIPAYDAEFPVTSGTDSRYGFLIANTGVVEGLSISASGQLVEIHVIIPLD